MRKKVMNMSYIVRKDTGLKARKVSASKVAKLKKQRATYLERQKRITKKATKKRTTKRNLNTLSKRQSKKLNKTREKALHTRKKLQYKGSGAKGDIAFREVLDKTKWIDNFVSSNVWKFKVRGKNLMIMYLDGSVYIYFGVAKQFLGLLNVGSKGKWVWRRLIRSNVNYAKIK